MDIIVLKDLLGYVIIIVVIRNNSCEYKMTLYIFIFEREDSRYDVYKCISNNTFIIYFPRSVSRNTDGTLKHIIDIDIQDEINIYLQKNDIS
jgi:hypothetical protein